MFGHWLLSGSGADVPYQAVETIFWSAQKLDNVNFLSLASNMSQICSGDLDLTMG